MNPKLTPLVVVSVALLVFAAGYSAYRSFAHLEAQHPVTLQAQGTDVPTYEVPASALERGAPVEEGQMFAVSGVASAE